MSDETHDLPARPHPDWRSKWAAIALLSAGLAYQLGPERFLAKQAEGPILYSLPLPGDHGITVVDLVGVALLIGSAYALRRHRLG